MRLSKGVISIIPIFLNTLNTKGDLLGLIKMAFVENTDRSPNAMLSNPSLYDQLYQNAKNKGWLGWGGDQRILKGPDQIERIFSSTHTPQKGKALELGCGEGHLSRLLAKRNWRVTGVDISQVAINWAKSKTESELNITYLQGDLTQANILKGKKFDLIIDGNCLHCILDSSRKLFFSNIQRLLAAEGIFFVSTLCSHNQPDYYIYHNNLPYRHILSVKRLQAELSQAGFHILETHYQEKEKEGHAIFFCRHQA